MNTSRLLIIVVRIEAKETVIFIVVVVTPTNLIRRDVQLRIENYYTRRKQMRQHIWYRIKERSILL
jgi:hypothetical protein